MKKDYTFRILKDDGNAYEFTKAFYSAYLADRWATKCFLLWAKGIVNYRITFIAA